MKRLFAFVGGLLLMMLGIFMIPTPFPLGIVFFPAGLALVMISSPTVRGWVHVMRLKFSLIDQALRKIEDRLPQRLRQVLESDATDEPLKESL
ncbi:MAG: hypothetical protein ACR2OW_16430 [Methyloligellaceae bacterium]